MHIEFTEGTHRKRLRSSQYKLDSRTNKTPPVGADGGLSGKFPPDTCSPDTRTIVQSLSHIKVGFPFGFSPSLPKSPFPRPSPQGTPEALPSPILRRMSSTSQSHAAPCSAWLRGAPARQPRRAGRHARAWGEAWPPAGALGDARPGWWRKHAVCFSYPLSVNRQAEWCSKLTTAPHSFL